MIYLDNAATSFPKPPAVHRAWRESLYAYGANPGHSGHRFAEMTASAVFRSRSKCAELFGADAENTVFTLNCTHALNIAIKGLGREGCHYVTSDLEHNAVIRPIYAAAEHFGGGYTIFHTDDDDSVTLENAERAIKPNTVALVCTAASNVTGRRLPLKGLADVCRRKGVCFIVDAAQGAGVIPLSLDDGINIICVAGHKGLYGPMGTGLLLTDGAYPLSTLIEGGTGSHSESLIQPDILPDRFESGTINTPGAITLGVGADFVDRKGIASIYRHEMSLCLRFAESMRRIDNIRLYTDLCTINMQNYVPVVPFNIKGMTASEGAQLLSENGIYMRGGLHCAPLAHRKIGTIDDGGTIRFSPSVFNTMDEVSKVIGFLSRI